ncbi:hypothetical protein Patl1_22611 [Pistacia atlantica]|uniref:Uncharacterized protein n=1 Tax=Pistacia atlantica TaxID=434234 RepID=A0ACC1A1K4_9ROSI|nr:hypothetical protein Patl1_22611 [Pistacia atlantica]
MADSQPESKVFSVRIVSIDHYMAPPIPGYDICYSSFQGGKVDEVPVIRIYGSTPAGQKTCLHVHRALPYLYVPCADIPLQSDQEGDAYTNAISLGLEKALKVLALNSQPKGNSGSNRQHVHGCSLVRAKRFYGYHSSEELFVKIYLYPNFSVCTGKGGAGCMVKKGNNYYPHDVSRAANLLLAGAVLDKSLQPHESHIPFLLQFLVDYNLYGMSHLHLSKVKFRHPVPDVFSPRKFNYDNQHLKVMDKWTQKNADFQADWSESAPLSSPFWVSSKIPGDWFWQFSNELDGSSDRNIRCIKRQSVCELEGDATIDDIVNQQFIMYTSLSQTRSDVKMVQSLIPIWEEEYERTGMCEAAMPPDPCKPLAQDVLKTLSLDLKCENVLMDLCGGADEVISSCENDVRVVKSSTDDEENLIELGLVHSKNSDPEHLSSLKERNTTESLSSQGLLHQEEMCPITSKGIDACHKISSADEIQSSQMIGTLSQKASDTELLDLLKWLATSQAAEDINSDDELLRETILSPLLPETTIDKVLDKANTDYERESQRELQDILDSIEDVTNFDGLEDSFDPSNHPQTSPEKKIPQVDGSSDDLYLLPCAGSAENSSKEEIISESERSFRHSVPRDTGTNVSSKHNTSKTLWGSLPFSTTQKVNDDIEPVSLNSEATRFLACNETGNCSDVVMKSEYADAPDTEEATTLSGFSLRDLMRRKRCHRVEPPEHGTMRVKRALLAGEQKEDITLLPKQLDLNILQNDEHDKGLLQASGGISLVDKRKKELPRPFNTKNEKSAVMLCHREVDNGKKSNSGASSTEATNCTVCTSESDSLLDVQLLKLDTEVKPFDDEILQQTDRTGSSCFHMSTSPGHESRTSMERVHVITNEKLVGLDTMAMQNEKCIGGELQGNHVSRSDPNNKQEAAVGIPIQYLNDGSCLYMLTPALTPPSVDCVYRWLLHNDEGTSGLINAASVEPSSPKGHSNILISSYRFLHDDCNKDLIESGSDMRPVLEEVHQESVGISNAELNLVGNEATVILQSEGLIAEVNACTNRLQDISQISGPDGRSRPTPLSQIGFRDPASVGAGEQLTLLSVEVQAESRGDLDLILNMMLSMWSLDGIPDCKVFAFSEEKHLFSHFIKILSSFDPDILMGWDIQGGSLGFLAERAAHLGIGLLNDISRTPLESKRAAGNLENSQRGILDNLVPESVIEDSVILKDAIVEDEWGRTHASGVHVGGRIVLNVWRLMRGEVKLNLYTVEAVAEAVLRRKTPSIPYKVLSKWFSSGPGRARYRCVEYVVGRAKLNLEIMNQLDMVNRTSELARVFGIDFFSVLSRGSQYRVESMFLRLAHTQNYLAISPGNHQVASQPAMECLPLVMEPESGFYADPVVVLDFQSLYPSMIIAYNLCFCTCLGKVVPSKENTLGVSSFLPESHVLRDLKDQILLTPNGVMYVPSKVRKGVLPRLLDEILSTRIMVKQAMKKLAPSQQVLHRIFNARQLALKLIANVTYGYTAAGFSGRMPCAELADSIVQCGRRTLEKAISFVNSNDKWKAKVIYGDTDSMFVLLKGRTVKESFQIGQEIASAVTAMNPNPVTLKMEKVYHPCFLLTKKRYVGYSYESPDQTEPVFDAKGIETVRRDTCAAVAKMMEQSFETVKAYLQRQWTRILSGRVSLQDFVFAKEVRLGTYSTRTSSSLPPAAIVATKAMRTDPRAEPRYGERVPYVVIHGQPGARLVDMVVDPLDLLGIDSSYRLNDLYYINKQIIPALQRVFGLVGADLNNWFLEMPRPSRDAFAKRPASAHLCNKCSRKETTAATAIIGRTSKLEREMQHLASICRHCGGGDWLLESGVKCTSLACSVFYERRKVQKELQGLSAVAAEKGLYPKCMIEWF